MHLIGTPDSVILLGDKEPGRVIQGTLEQLKANTNIVDLISSSEQEHKDDEVEGTTDSTGSSSRAISTAKKEDESKTGLLRKSGDLSLYSYYFAAVGWDRVAYLFFGGIMFAVLHVLPGERFKLRQLNMYKTDFSSLPGRHLAQGLDRGEH